MKNFVVLCAALSLLCGMGTSCSSGPASDPSSAATLAAAEATQAAAQATKAAAALAIAGVTQQATTTPSQGPSVAPTSAPEATPTARSPVPPAAPSEPCVEWSEPFWHWQAGRPVVRDLFFTSSAVGFAVGSPYSLLRTDDGGSSWEARPIDAGQFLNSVWFADKDRGWVAGESGTILHTEDAGTTWHVQPTGTKYELLVVKFLDAETGWAGGVNGTLLRTTDGGATWSAGVGCPNMDVRDVAFVDPMEGYLVGYGGAETFGKVLHTSDGGATWEDTGTSAEKPGGIYAAQGMPVWIAGSWTGGSLWKGVGGRDQCQQVIHDMGNTMLSEILFTDALHGWAAGDDLVLYTQDGGEYWQVMEVPEDTWWQALHLTPDGELVMAGRKAGYGGASLQVLQSSDGGATWTSAMPLGLDTDQLTILDLEFVDLWFGYALAERRDDQVLLKTSDGGRTWESHELPRTEIVDLEFVDRQLGWAIGDAGLVVRTDDGGESWQIQPLLFGEDLWALSFVDRDRGWVVAPGDRYYEELALFRTDTGGKTWEGPVYIPVPDLGQPPSASVFLTGQARPLSIDFVSPEVGWIAGVWGMILRTSDGGATWEAQNTGTVLGLLDAHFLDARTGWAAGEKGVVLRTIDGGESWEQERLGDAKLTCVRFVDAQTGWVTTVEESYPRGMLWRTSDGGRTWSELLVPGLGRSRALDAVDAQHVWVGGELSGVFAYSPVCLSSSRP